MSDREKIIALLDSVPDYKMGYVLAYVQGITAGEKTACGIKHPDDSAGQSTEPGSNEN